MIYGRTPNRNKTAFGLELIQLDLIYSRAAFVLFLVFTHKKIAISRGAPTEGGM